MFDKSASAVIWPDLAGLTERPVRIFVVRHGESVWNRTKRISGQLDPALSVAGLAQAQRLCETLSEVHLDAIYTSTLSRSIATAAPTACWHGITPRACHWLDEQNLGSLQGRYRNDRDPQALALWNERGADVLRFQPPGGETYDELQRRVTEGLRQLCELQAGRTVLIVGHRNTNRPLLAALLGWTAEEAIATKLKHHDLYDIAPAHSTFVRTISLRDRDRGRAREGFRA